MLILIQNIAYRYRSVNDLLIFFRIQRRQVRDVRGRQREHARPDPEERQPQPLPHRDGQVRRVFWKAKVMSIAVIEQRWPTFFWLAGHIGTKFGICGPVNVP